MKKLLSILSLVCLGCSSQEVPPAHKGRMFDKTGAWALWIGGKGFTGPILGPGVYYTGIYPEVRMLDCSQKTVKESMNALTKDGVQFNLDVYISYSANCDEEQAVNFLLEHLTPEADPEPVKGQEQAPAVKSDKLTITSSQVYRVYIRPAIGEAVRESVAAEIANDINSKRESLFSNIKLGFEHSLNKQSPKLIQINTLNLSNLDFPDQMDKANTERAVQAILKDKAVAERARVEAEIETTKMRKQLAENETNNEVVRIDGIGAALKRNPEYLTFDLQQKLPEIYVKAGEKGNLVITAPSPNLLISPRQPIVEQLKK